MHRSLALERWGGGSVGAGLGMRYTGVTAVKARPPLPQPLASTLRSDEMQRVSAGGRQTREENIPDRKQDVPLKWFRISGLRPVFPRE